MSMINPTQFSGTMRAAGQVAKPAAVGGLLGGPTGMALGAGYGALQTPAAHTAESNIGNIASGAARGGMSGIRSGLNAAGPVGGFLGGPIGAIRGAAASPAGHNVISSAESGAKRGFMFGGPAGGILGGAIGAIGGLFHNRGAASPAQPAAKPAAAPSSQYTIQRGDTLSGIAQKNNMSLNQLYAANPEFKTNPKYQGGNMIWSGGKVNIPGASPAPLNQNQMQKATMPAAPKPAGIMGPAMPKTSAPGRPMPGVMGSIQNMPFKMGTPTTIQNMPYKGNRPTITPL